MWNLCGGWGGQNGSSCLAIHENKVYNESSKKIPMAPVGVGSKLETIVHISQQGLILMGSDLMSFWVKVLKKKTISK